MKTIILVRHAKSSWKDPTLEDFDRPLNKRGKKNAPFMGAKLKERGILPDLMVSSPAKRARKTAMTIAKAVGYPKKKIRFDGNLYHAGAQSLFKLVKRLKDKHQSVMLFGHNPGFNDFADLLLKHNTVLNIPTTGVYCINFEVDRWDAISAGSGKAAFFDFPKRYPNPSL
jgi:phosphohistidine phosphatase